MLANAPDPAGEFFRVSQRGDVQGGPSGRHRHERVFSDYTGSACRN
jgi:hypothetical protein